MGFWRPERARPRRAGSARRRFGRVCPAAGGDSAEQGVGVGVRLADRAHRGGSEGGLEPAVARAGVAGGCSAGFGAGSWPRAPYDLRHAAVSTWLNAGVPSTQVAEWAGHSVGVLHQIAKCIVEQQEAARWRIDAVLRTGRDT